MDLPPFLIEKWRREGRLAKETAELDAKWDALENDPEFLAKPIWQQIIEIGALVPQSEWRKHLPTDFARNFEHDFDSKCPMQEHRKR